MRFGNDGSTTSGPRAAEGESDGAGRAARCGPPRRARGPHPRALRRGARAGAGASGGGSEAAARLRRARRGGRRFARARPALLSRQRRNERSRPRSQARRHPPARRRSVAVRGADARSHGCATAARFALPAARRRSAAGGGRVGAGPRPARAAAGGARQALAAGRALDGAGPRRAGEEARGGGLRARSAGGGPGDLRGARRRLRRLVAARGTARPPRVLRRRGREDPRLRSADAADDPRSFRIGALPRSRDRARRRGTQGGHRHRARRRRRGRDALAGIARVDRRAGQVGPGRRSLCGGPQRNSARLLSGRALAGDGVSAGRRALGPRRSARARAPVGRPLDRAGGELQRSAPQGRIGARARPALSPRARRAAVARALDRARAVGADGRRRGSGHRRSGVRPRAHRRSARGDPGPSRRGWRAAAAGAQARGASRTRHGGGCSIGI